MSLCISWYDNIQSSKNCRVLSRHHVPYLLASGQCTFVHWFAREYHKKTIFACIYICWLFCVLSFAIGQCTCTPYSCFFSPLRFPIELLLLCGRYNVHYFSSKRPIVTEVIVTTIIVTTQLPSSHQTFQFVTNTITHCTIPYYCNIQILYKLNHFPNTLPFNFFFNFSINNVPIKLFI